MNDLDQSFADFQAAQQARHCAENWLAAFETALTARDAGQIASWRKRYHSLALHN